MTPTHQIVLAIAERIRAACPREADKLLFVASDVRWLERRVNELVADEVAASQRREDQMRQEIHASLRIELVEDPEQAARILASFATAWASMLSELGVEVEANVSLSEMRARGPGRPRKPRLVPAPEAA